MSSLIDPLQKLLGFLQNNSLLGFPYLYWAISGVVSILLCICICCCMCCRKKKRASNEKQLRELHDNNNVPKRMVRAQSISADITQMTTVDAATRRSMGSTQHNQEHDNYNKHQQQKQRKQQKQQNQQPQQSPYNQNFENNNGEQSSSIPKINQNRAERTFAGLKPEKTNYDNNNSYDNNPNHTNNQNQYGNNNNYGNRQYDNNQQYYGNNQYDGSQQYGHNQNQNQNGNNNNWNQTQNQSQYQNDNNNQHNQYGNNNNNINPNEYHQQVGNDQQIEQNDQHIATNDNNSHKANKSFGVKIVPKSIYHPVSYKNVFNAKTANTNINKFSRSPQPNQSYNLRANQQNNHPSNSAPAPAPNTNQIQQQYPAPISHQPPNNNNINNQGYEIRKLGDGQSQSQHRNKKKKNKRMKHAPAFSAIDESKLKKQQSNAPSNMKLDIQVDDFEDEAQEIKAPPKRNRNKENNNQLSPVGAGGAGYGGLSAPKFRKKRGDVNPDDYSDSEERAKMSQWDARRSSVNAGTQLSTGNGVDPFKGRRKSVFDESSSDEEELGGRRLTVDMTSARNNKVSSHMANMNKYQ